LLLKFFMKQILILCSLAFILCGCSNLQQTATEPNTLTHAEQRAGWTLLWDGKTAAGWHDYRGGAFPAKGWTIENGELHKIAHVNGGDIVTDKTYSEFEFRWDWKIAPHGNNGIKYFVTDERRGVGHEYQMLDDAGEPEGKTNGKHSTASFYDVLPPFPNKPSALRPAGEWNSSGVSVRGNHVEHWLNGQKVFEYELGSDEVKAGVAKSKFKNVPHFGERVKGRILLTDHGDECFFRNLKIRDYSKD
jgi:hypothetical protein